MRQRTARRTLSGLVATLTIALLALGLTLPRTDQRPAPDPGAAWSASLAQMDDALGRGDASGARQALREAYAAARRDPSWAGMLAVGDAYLRTGVPRRPDQSAKAGARECYVAALLRARQQGSLEGVLRVTEAFAALGDREVVDVGLRIAGGLASDAQAWKTVWETSVRSGVLMLTAERDTP